MVHHLENHACFGQGRYIGVGTSELLFIFLAAIAGVCVCKAKLEQPDFWKSEILDVLGALLYSVTWTNFCFVSIIDKDVMVEDTQRSALFLRDMSNHRRSQYLFVKPQQVAKGTLRVLAMLPNFMPQIIVGMWRHNSFFSPCSSRLTWSSSWCRDM